MEDAWLDDFGTQDEYWDDAEQFERNQLALDNEDEDEYDDEGWDGDDADEFYEDSEPPF
jgi:U3 small nucleolar ribonucleoprotein component